MNFSWYLEQFSFKGRPVSGGTVEFFVAGSTTTPKNIWYDLNNTVLAPNPITLDASGTMPQIYPESGLYLIIVRDSSGAELYTRDNVSGNLSGSGLDDHLVLSDSTDTRPSNLFNKLSDGLGITHSVTEGTIGNAISISATPWVSSTGSDVPGFLINKVSNLGGGLQITAQSGKVNFNLDYSAIKGNLLNTPYSIWFSGSNGNLAGTQALSFGDPSRQAALYAPSIQAQGSMVVGSSGNAFWDEDNFYLRYPANNGIVQLSPDSTDKYIYAHNSLGNASIVTDKASFANLANNGVVFACEWPHSSEDQIFLHTQTGFSFSPSTNLLTTPKLSTGTLNISSLTTSGVLVNDSNGNITSTPIGNFTDDHLVYVDALDTVPGYLGTKLAAGTNIGFSVTSDSHGQKLWISARSNMLLNPTYVTANYTVVDTDNCVVNIGAGVTITMPTPGSTYNGRAIIVHNMGTASITPTNVIANAIPYGGSATYRCIKDYTGSYFWTTENFEAPY